ncbi:hypothetical protein CERZMDRAFT_86992 [Cercospora zeae-maydis SCOH1-5]|uniref:Zn(2)-C6 fungal-type domain-containing protein n=1 Tax=Cercospora zeae-maydis SCOH1-5 TaxID=717836 RepID=A0A6A6F602_9PEZI|nr:hypothetical protein CERZMDRAFT_86992 [Cercospora zeae-maydis SCOH1-5]
MTAEIDPALDAANADGVSKQLPGITAAPPGPPAMATLQPTHPDQYRALPPPQTMYPPPYAQPQQMGYPPAQPAPRQRTAIACRYCRRRKIRCSGFEQSEDGRCTNCVRFSQECVFTPVSAQTQAFVPAHTVWRGQNPPPNTQLYGAYGQPLPANSRDGQYAPQQQGQPQQPGQYPPPPQGYQQQAMYPQQGQTANAGTKRANDEPHTPTLPPPNPGEQAQMPQQGQYGYGVSPAGASPAFFYHASRYPAQPFPHAYHIPPQSPYSYEAPRVFSPPFPPHAHPVKSNASASQHVAKTEDERNITDSSMLSAFNRGSKPS